MKKIAYLIILLISSFTSDLFSQSKLSKAEYDVYGAVLESFYAQNYQASKVKYSFVISEITVKLDFVPSFPSEKIDEKTLADYLMEIFSVNSDDKSLVKSFKKNNKKSTTIEKQLSTGYEYQIISNSQVDEMLKINNEIPKYYKKCYPCGFSYIENSRLLRKKYPNALGFYKLSRVGFSKDQKLALVYFDESVADSGKGGFYLMENKNNQWQVKQFYPVFEWEA